MALDVPDITGFEAYEQYRRNIKPLKDWLTRVIPLFDVDITGDQIQGVASSLFNFDNELDRITQISGLETFIRIIEEKPASYNLRTQYLVTAGLINDAIDLVKAVNADVLTTGAWDDQGKPVYAVFTPAQSASFKASLQAILDSMS